MTNIDEKVNRKIEFMKKKAEKGNCICPSSVNWFSLKDEINKEHLKKMIIAFYELPWVKEAYAKGTTADGDCEKYFCNHTMKFYQQGENVEEIARRLPSHMKMELIRQISTIENKPYLEKYLDNILEDIFSSKK